MSKFHQYRNIFTRQRLTLLYQVIINLISKLHNHKLDTLTSERFSSNIFWAFKYYLYTHVQ